MARMTLIMLLVTASAAVPDWKLEYEKSDLRVYSRVSAGSKVREFRVEGSFDHPPQSVWKLLQDVEYLKRVPYVAEYRIVEQPSPVKRLVYTRLAFPIISDRDYFLESEIVTSPELGTPGRWKNQFRLPAEVRPKRSGVVRVPVCEGYWELRATDDGKRTLATYVLKTDPGGLIPRWMSEAANSRAFPDVFGSMATELEKQAAAVVDPVEPPAPIRSQPVADPVLPRP